MLADYLNQTVGYRQFMGDNVYGDPSYNLAEILDARVSYRQKLVYNQIGEQVASFCHVTIQEEANYQDQIILVFASGAIWTQSTASAAFKARYYHTTVVYDNKMWVIGGYGAGYLNDVWYSSDGVTWTQSTASAAFKARRAHTSVVYDNKMWVIGGYGGGFLNDVWYSSDELTRVPLALRHARNADGTIHHTGVDL